MMANVYKMKHPNDHLIDVINKQDMNIDDEESEIIEEIVTYEVPLNKTKPDEKQKDNLLPTSDSRENSYADDSEDDSFDEKSGSEICETICEIMTYQASVDSNQDEQEDQETLCEIVTYKIKETFTRNDQSEADREPVVEEVVDKNDDIDNRVEEMSDLEEKNVEHSDVSEDGIVEAELKSLSEDQLDKNSGSEVDEISLSEDIFVVSSIASKENSSPRSHRSRNVQKPVSDSLILNEYDNNNSIVMDELSADIINPSDSETISTTTAPFVDSTLVISKHQNNNDLNETISEEESFEKKCATGSTVGDELSEDDDEITNSKTEGLQRTAEIYFKDKPDLQRDIIREKCRHYSINAKVDWNNFDADILEFYEMFIPDEAMHGDIITTSEKVLRSMEVYFVNAVLVELDEAAKKEKNYEYNYKLVRRLCQDDLGGSGYCCVPKVVTSKMSEPIKFYENSFTFDNYDEIDFAGIDLDTEVHQELIKRYTGGRNVDLGRKCFWMFSNNEWDSSCGVFIWCDFFLDDFDAGRYLKLTPEIDDEYLTRAPTPRRDPQIIKYALEMKQKYEIKYTDMFKTMQPDTELEVYGLTFFCPKNNQPNGGVMVTMNFSRILRGEDGESVSEIVLNKACEDGTKNVEEFSFRPKVVTEYGRYGGVALWCIENALLPGEEDANTYIICTSDIFY